MCADDDVDDVDVDDADVDDDDYDDIAFLIKLEFVCLGGYDYETTCPPLSEARQTGF